VNIRLERGEDAAAIRHVLVAAFSGNVEADLVEQLRRDGDLALAMVAENDGIQGYVASPKLRIEDSEATHDAVGLAPLAVAPDAQKQGIGSALVREAHRRLVAQGCALSFVLGDPSYYARFGYDLALAAPFECAYAGPHFMALRFNDNAPKRGRVRYPAAFDQLG
jgi:putative acetyltransferase